jgi:hypothetical protein
VYRLQYLKANFSSTNSIVAITILLSIAVLPFGLQGQDVFAQNSSNVTSANTTANAIDSFRAQGQISSLVSDTLAGRENSTENVMWVLGGDWELNVADGNVTNFVVDIDMTQIDGTAAHKHTIEKVNNTMGMSMLIVNPLKLDLMTSQPGEKILLVRENSTMFRGITDLTTKEKVQWSNVPIHVTLLNGHILNLAIDPTKTDDHFKGLPVFGTVQSMVDKNGRELLNK